MGSDSRDPVCRRMLPIGKRPDDHQGWAAGPAFKGAGPFGQVTLRTGGERPAEGAMPCPRQALGAPWRSEIGRLARRSRRRRGFTQARTYAYRTMSTRRHRHVFRPHGASTSARPSRATRPRLITGLWVGSAATACATVSASTRTRSAARPSSGPSPIWVVHKGRPDYVRSSSRSRRTHGIGASWERGHLARADARGPLGAGWKPALPGSRALENPALPGSPRSLDELGT